MNEDGAGGGGGDDSLQASASSPTPRRAGMPNSKSVNFDDDQRHNRQAVAPTPTPRSQASARGSYANHLNKSIDFYATHHAYVNDMKYIGDQIKVGRVDPKAESELEKRFKKHYEARRKLLSPNPARLGVNPDPRALSTMDTLLLDHMKKQREAKLKQPIIVGQYKDLFFERSAKSGAATARSAAQQSGGRTSRTMHTHPTYMVPTKPLVDMKTLREMHEELTSKVRGQSSSASRKK